MSLPTTPSQTVGPFFSIGLDRLCTNNFCAPEVRGERITIHGRVLDGDNQPVPDAVLEIWQADTAGNFPHPESPQPSDNSNFTGFGRVATNDAGEFHFTTIKPGSTPGPNNYPQAPHLSINLFMRGLLKHLVTRIYFPDDPLHSTDFALNLIEPNRRGTLIAKSSSSNPASLGWNIHLQGPNETIFFDL
jgi:protocatechuate 3,4-dioxygenase alpha subunit